MKPTKALRFDETEIQRLFGNEAGESETIQRLREYYFKTPIYNQIIANLPMRILVGHKGIGKSALFKVAMDEDVKLDRLSILIRPDDIHGIAESDNSILSLIQEWKKGLSAIIGEKIVKSFGVESTDDQAKWLKQGARAFILLAESIKKLREYWNVEPGKLALLEHFLENKQVFVYIDDLDRGWEGRPQDIKRISALLNAARDLSADSTGIHFKIALRSDVYFLVRTSDESTDKIDGSVIWYSWVNHEILIMLVKRILTYFGESWDDGKMALLPQERIAQNLELVMEPRFVGKGKWGNIPTHRMLMSLIRKRPRDLVKLCTLAARQAYLSKCNKIGTKEFEQIFQEYSQGRIQDAINEYRTELPGIDKLLLGMKPTRKEKTTKEGYVFGTDALLQKLTHLNGHYGFVFASKKKADARELLNFLYKINFLTARKETKSGIDRKYFEENRYVSNTSVDFGYSWEIHPAYRWALQPESMSCVLESMDE